MTSAALGRPGSRGPVFTYRRCVRAAGPVRIAHRGYVLETGRVALEDRAAALLNENGASY